MATYRSVVTAEIREIPAELYAAWQAVGNPKAGAWEPWEVTSPPPPPSPDWTQFKATALGSVSLNLVMADAYQSAPVAAGALAAALLRAEQGEPQDFATTWAAIGQAVTVPPEAVAGFIGVAQACNLPTDFMAALAPLPE
jgi:hypothetical protein